MSDDALPDWRNYLHDAERRELEALERRAQELDADRLGVTAKITILRNRCSQRRRAAAQLEGAR